jgi:hypothetical protein
MEEWFFFSLHVGILFQTAYSYYFLPPLCADENRENQQSVLKNLHYGIKIETSGTSHCEIIIVILRNF